MSNRRAALKLELEVGETPITGQLTFPSGERKAFAGWVALVSLIARANGEPVGIAGTEDERPQVPLPRRNP